MNGHTIIATPADLEQLAPGEGEVTVVLSAVRCPADHLAQVSALAARFEALAPEMTDILAEYITLARAFDQLHTGVPDDLFDAFRTALGWDRFAPLQRLLDSLQ